ncbi:hypothetical protein R50073_44530 [Maricurvus nonylphenolicus]
MKSLLRQVCAPVLTIFESGDGDYAYKPSHRIVLIVMGCLFSGLAAMVVALMLLGSGGDPGYAIPALVFGGAGLVSLIVGTLGNDRAVAKIWGSR